MWNVEERKVGTECLIEFGGEDLEVLSPYVLRGLNSR